MINGLLGKKIGMSQVFQEDGKAQAATLVEAGPCVVVQVKTEQKDGYSAVQLGFDVAKKEKSPLKGHMKGLGNFKYLREIRVEDSKDIKIGDKIDVTLFEAGQKIDVCGVSKGKGFAGTVKRYGFAGGPKTHGQSDRHRAPGSIGAGSTPGKVFKGTRMSGHMGTENVTVAKLEVLGTDVEKNLLVIKGAVPGANNGLLVIKKSGK